MMNGSRAGAPPADDVAVELGMARNENVPPVAEGRSVKPSRIQLVSSWWLALSRSAPEGIGIAGIKYILVSRESQLRRFGWLCILLLAMSALTLHILERGIYFSKFPLSVDISLNQSAKKLTFPKVVICNFNMFVKSETQARPAVDKACRNYENMNYNPNGIIPLTDEELHYLRNTNTSHLYEELKHKKEDMFVRVVFGGEPLSLDEIVPVSTSFGRCYQINDGLDGRKLLQSSGTGKMFGLSLILNAEEEKYYYNAYLRDAAGFTFQLLDQDETHSLTNEDFQVGPGTSAAVAITAKQQHNAKPPYGVCGEKKLQYFDKYSRTKCLVECMTDAVVAECGCRSPALPGPHRVCDPLIIGNCTSFFFEQGAENMARSARTCNCPINCDEKSFSVSLSTAKYPSAFRADLVKEYAKEGLLNFPGSQSLNRSSVEHNFAAVDMFFTDISTTVITQLPAYSFFAFMCDVGGAMGLWLGGSLLTLYEIIDLIGHSFFSTRH